MIPGPTLGSRLLFLILCEYGTWKQAVHTFVDINHLRDVEIDCSTAYSISVLPQRIPAVGNEINHVMQCDLECLVEIRIEARGNKMGWGFHNGPL